MSQVKRQNAAFYHEIKIIQVEKNAHICKMFHEYSVFFLPPQRKKTFLSLREMFIFKGTYLRNTGFLNTKYIFFFVAF